MWEMLIVYKFTESDDTYKGEEYKHWEWELRICVFFLF